MNTLHKLLEIFGLDAHHVPNYDISDYRRLVDRDLLIANLGISISNHLKIEKIMSQIDDLLQAEKDENSVISQLAGSVKSLAEGYNALEQKVKDLTESGSASAAQLQELSADIASGKQSASDALAAAQAILNPASTATETPAATADTTSSGS